MERFAEGFPVVQHAAFLFAVSASLACVAVALDFVGQLVVG